MAAPFFADVAELADAQVSEACDGDIVEVQVLSSAPIGSLFGEPFIGFAVFFSWGSFQVRLCGAVLFSSWLCKLLRISS
jgi:hypothetical protein